MVIATSRSVIPQEIKSILIDQEAGWDPEWVWTFRAREKPTAPKEIRIPNRPVRIPLSDTMQSVNAVLINKRCLLKEPFVKHIYTSAAWIKCIYIYIYIYRVARSRLTHFEFEYCAGAIACRGWRQGKQ